MALTGSSEHLQAAVFEPVPRPVPRSLARLVSWERECLRLLLVVAMLSLSTPFTTVANSQYGDSEWEQPVVLFDAGAGAHVFSPMVVVDTCGQLRVLWEVVLVDRQDSSNLHNGIYCIEGDGIRWSDPVDVLVPAGSGRIYWPQHAVDTWGRVHLVWVGSNAELRYSRAPSHEACQARSWSTPILPATHQVLHGDVTVDEEGTIHIVYAATGQDVYYIRSQDDGLSWSDPMAVSTVQSGVATAFPSLAVDSAGRVHVVWEEAQLPEGFPSLGLFYASSLDEGQTWSLPLMLAREGYTEPNVAVLKDDTVHLLWNGRVNTRGRYHQWSSDGGTSWSTPIEFIPKSLGGGQTGAPRFAEDSAGSLHVVSGTDDTSHVAWSSKGWSRTQKIMAFAVFGNLEHQNIAVERGRILHVVANADLQRIIYVQGQTNAPEITPQIKVSPTALEPPEVETPVIGNDRAEVSSATGTPPPVALAKASPPPVPDSLSPIVLGAAISLVTVLAVVVVALKRHQWR